ncbi:unnamed protein product [Bursaphelenchus okinawaensis]|uniref:Helicase ATP-binding domain-containing protein n=1 Tax=Bursaphelenchus okinawaensis TaxID=465554 RepID=A0A811LV55_9BILA|nr:unnamed protein product [Bursaphelenchus okinawaensis]CAG9127843.1 unnamed protein product [Bursaphelenchus okinawaensis]
MGNEQSGPSTSAANNILNNLPINGEQSQPNNNFSTYRRKSSEFLTDDEDCYGEDYKRVHNMLRQIEKKKVEKDLSDDESSISVGGLDDVLMEMDISASKSNQNSQSLLQDVKTERMETSYNMDEFSQDLDELMDQVESTESKKLEAWPEPKPIKTEVLERWERPLESPAFSAYRTIGRFKVEEDSDDEKPVDLEGFKKEGQTATVEITADSGSDLSTWSFTHADVKFPDEYAYLQKLNKIDEGAVKQNRILFDYLMRDQNNMTDLIQKQIAIICLYWAQGLIESRQPIFLDAILQYKKHRIVKYVVGGKEKMATITYFSCLMPEERRQPNFRSAADRINLVTVIREGIVLFEGFVHYKKNGEVVLKVDRVKKDLLTELQQVTALDVDLYEQPNDFVPQAMLNAVQGVKMGLIDSILMPKPTEKGLKEYEQALQSALRQHDKQPHLAFLNAEQKAVIHAVDTHAHAGFPFVLYGPPGTGKTETISALVLTLLKKSPSTRILICTPSNMAANRVTEKLMEHFGNPYNDVLTKQNLLRLVSSSNDYEKRDKKFDSVVSANLALKKFVIPNKPLLISQRVIVCTLASSTHLIKRDVPRGHFDYIMIDEAGQASEAEVWIPLGGLADRTTSVVLCGDPKQLGPVITLNLPKYMTDKFVSPLHRFMQNPQYLKDLRICVQLKECFRCHDAIVNITSKLFYNNTLKPGGDANLKEQLSGWKFLSKKGFPVMFIDVLSGYEEQDPRGTSFGNSTERAYITEGVVALMREMSVAATDIGIISPYRYQSRMILEDLKKHSELKHHIDDLTVDSVERFQGSERKVIFMTCTRTNSLGFVACSLRLNTSITRAQQLLVIVGNSNALRRHDAWRKFIDYCKENGSYKASD